MPDRPAGPHERSSIRRRAASHAGAPAGAAAGGREPVSHAWRISAAIREWAGHLQRETHALFLACRDHRTPWYARALAGFVVAYALSPIDLIPDVIPVFGALDDLVILPLGLELALRLIPPEVMDTARRQASDSMPTSEGMRGGAAIVVAIWLLTAMIAIAVGWTTVRR